MPNLKPIGAVIAVLSLPGCIVAYKEAQARRDGLSDDPESGSFYHYDKGLAERKTSGMRQDLRNAEASLEARQAELTRLRSRLANLKAERATATTAEKIALLDAEIIKMERRILSLEEAT